MVEKRPLRTSSARVRPSSGEIDPRRAKISTAMITCKGMRQQCREWLPLAPRRLCCWLHRPPTHHEDAQVTILGEKERVGSFTDGLLDVCSFLHHLHLHAAQGVIWQLGETAGLLETRISGNSS
jgi:hypothetical protein